MPRGVPVATVAINNATNAGLLAVRMLGIQDADLLARLGSLSVSLTADSVLRMKLQVTMKFKKKKNNFSTYVLHLLTWDLLFCRMSQYQEDTRNDVLTKAEKLEKEGWESYLNL